MRSMVRAGRGARFGPADGAVVVAVALAVLALGGPVLGAVALWIGIGLLAVGRRGLARGLVRGAVALVGWLVLIAALDWGIGTLWNAATDDDDDVVVAGEDLVDIADVDLPPATDRRGDLPAYDGVPWAQRYFQEMDALRYGYVPLIGPRVSAVRSRYINSRDGIRRSYQPEPPAGVEPLEVWFFGGSTTWGEGQRDLYTVPSQVARVAEEHGVHLRPVNFGERGYNAYQEFLLLQQALDEHGPPDLAVFFDGQNELGTPLEDDPSPIDQPAIYQYATLRDTFERVLPLPDVSPTVEPSLGQDYAEVSLLHKLLRRVGAVAAVPPAGAQEQRPPFTQAEVRTLLRVYERSLDLAALVAERYDLPLERFWQPARIDNPNNLLDDDLPPGVHDIQDAYDHVDDQESIFIDGGHTNEVGSRLAAEAMWPHLRRTLERLAAQP
jgi:hypothetical protein